MASSYCELLPLVKKPSRYIGKEKNIPSFECKKNPVRIALAFPDTYEIGTSHLGLRILYYLLNSTEEVAAERVFAPARDYSNELRKRRLPLCTLETKTPLKNFDIVGFSLQYELGYTNLLNMLDLGGIPLHTSDRRKNDPFIIAGGPCAFNPEPLALFIDAFLIGDGEVAAGELCTAIKEGRAQKKPRSEILESLSAINGVYVPSLYETEEESATHLHVVQKGCAPFPVRRRIEFDLDSFPYPEHFPIPYCEAIHDRINIEISRGCNSGCRFCQAGIIYRPNRPRDPNQLLSTINANLANTGLDEVSLTSLDLSTYPGLEQFVSHLMHLFQENKISLSLPSVRTSALSENIAKAIQSVRKTGFTLAPEAGTQRLRDVINKGVSESDLLDAAGFAFSQGWQLIKLYFMIGLPTETDADVDAIFELAKKISAIGKKVSHRSGNINLSISTFVPKPHTPFQWYPMNDMERIRQKQYRLMSLARRYLPIKIKWHDPNTSYLEGIISRGDRRIGTVIERAFRNGALFDAWTDELEFTIWEEALRAENIDPALYLDQSYPVTARLPWSHIDTGVDPQFLIDELNKSKAGTLTPPCTTNDCRGCNVCTQDHLFRQTAPLSTPVEEPPELPQSDVFFMYQGYFKKTAELRFLSNREVINTLIRAFRRANISMHHSQGYNPHPRFSFGPALPVGICGLREPFRFEILEDIDPKLLMERLNATLPHEIQVIEIEKLSGNPIKMNDLCAIAHYEVDHCIESEALPQWHTKIAEFLEKNSIPFSQLQTDNSIKLKDLRPGIVKIELKKHKIELSLTQEARIQDVLEVLFQDYVIIHTIVRAGFSIRTPE